MTWADMRNHFFHEIIKKYRLIADDSTINLTKFKPLRGENVVLSKFCYLLPSKRSKVALSNAMPKPEATIHYLVNSPLISMTKCR